MAEHSVKRRVRERGQATVEYAIVTAGVVIPLTFGLILHGAIAVDVALRFRFLARRSAVRSDALLAGGRRQRAGVCCGRTSRQ